MFAPRSMASRVIKEQEKLICLFLNAALVFLKILHFSAFRFRLIIARSESEVLRLERKKNSFFSFFPFQV